eukprot:TRINITY_DN7463_c2_g1_i1.p1 TRINITY_DN7463_c2_g1~~TRINITY_DN7463_c2_g1_i1.p1  ORF type:complete len:300 (-),score=49.75 TRINITY_DN7463_c2_g1_i1:91-990(-)
MAWHGKKRRPIHDGDRDCVVSILANFNGKALRAMAYSSGTHVSTLREGMVSCKDKLTKSTRNKMNKLSVAFSAARHLTSEYCDQLLGDIVAELAPSPTFDDSRFNVKPVSLKDDHHVESCNAVFEKKACELEQRVSELEDLLRKMHMPPTTSLSEIREVPPGGTVCCHPHPMKEEQHQVMVTEQKRNQKQLTIQESFARAAGRSDVVRQQVHLWVDDQFERVRAGLLDLLGRCVPDLLDPSMQMMHEDRITSMVVEALLPLTPTLEASLQEPAELIVPIAVRRHVQRLLGEVSGGGFDQ